MRIKNWEKFQHFKDRRPPWIKLYRDLLDDAEWAELSPPNAKFLIMLWLLASEEKGELPDTKKIGFRLRMSEKSVKSIVSELSHWLIQDDIKTISTRHQLVPSETETETYNKETEATPLRASSVVDSDWIAELGKNPAYQHINLTVEIGKMEAWLGLPKNAKRIKTRSFVLNWLNKIEAPMSVDNGQVKPPPPPPKNDPIGRGQWGQTWGDPRKYGYE
jgi:hypothetical protein